MKRSTPALGLLLVGFGTTLSAQVVVWQRDAMGVVVQRHCQLAVWPKRIPALDAVLDSAALMTTLHALPEGDTTPTVFSVVYRPEGVTVHVEQMDTLPSVIDVPLMDAVSRGLRPMSAPRPLGAIRVRVREGLSATVSVDRSVYCPPEPAPGDAPGSRTALVAIEPGDRMPTTDRPVRMEAELTIDEAGTVTNVRLLVGSGIREVDETFVRFANQRRFLPALIDGLPIGSWVRTNRQRMRI